MTTPIVGQTIGQTIDTNDTTTIVAVAVAVAAVILLIVGALYWFSKRRSRARELKAKFGPEYDAVVADRGRRRAHSELTARLEEYDSLELDRVSPDQRGDYSDRWREIQYRFVENPGWSVRESEHLVVDVMLERGLPVDDVEARVRALSVTDPEISVQYRDAYAVFRQSEDGERDVSTLHGALIAYRSVFESLLDRPKREASVVGAEPPDQG